MIFFEVEQAHWIPDVLPRDEFCRTRFFREWVGPQGFMDGLFANVDKSATTCTLITLMRRVSDGLVDDELRRRFGLVIPHIRRALLIGMLADTLDGLASALFLVDGNGRIIHANASAHNMLSEGNVLRAPNGVLRTFDLRTDQALLDIFTAASGGDAPIGVKGIAVPLEARNGEAHIAHVLALTAGARRRAGTTYRAVAAIFVRKAALDARSPFEVIAQRFGLTDTELRVLFSIIEVGAPAEVAEVLGVREGTIRTHLHRLFEKTQTNRQADLVRLVASYTNPLVG
jgi:DNA-binding CsgD family transcriptional regulator